MTVAKIGKVTLKSLDNLRFIPGPTDCHPFAIIDKAAREDWERLTITGKTKLGEHIHWSSTSSKPLILFDIEVLRKDLV